MFEELGRKVKRARLNLDYTQKKAAELIGINVTYLSKIETGNIINPVSDDVAIAIAKTLGLDKTEVLSLSGRIEPEMLTILKRLLMKHPDLSIVIYSMDENHQLAVSVINYVKQLRKMNDHLGTGVFRGEMM